MASPAASLSKPLNRRKRVTVELPDLLVRAIRVRMDEANGGEADQEEVVTFNDVIEWLLVTEITLKRIPCSKHRFWL